jgi:cell division GTPase FtsZ
MSDIDTPDIPLPQAHEKPETKDECAGAFKLAFIGSGQGGSRLAATFHKLGYRRVCVINTAEQDLTSIPLPDAQKLVIGSGGAGKQPSVAAKIFESRKEDVLDFMRRSFGPTLDRIIVCAGAGGGTGAGTVVPLVHTAYELQVALKCPTDKVGVILALPKNSEGKKVNENAFMTLTALCDLVDAGKVSPLIVLDNERISSIHPGLAVSPFWDTANSSVCSLLHLFNSICLKSSSYTSFDTADFQTVLDSGLIVFGATPVVKWDEMTSISYAVRDNLRRNILSGGVNLSSGSVASAVVIGGESILSTLPQENLDHAFDQLTRLLKPGSTVHRGIYSGSKESLVVYTAIGGLARPKEKLEELRRFGDVTFATKPGGPVMGEPSN